MVVSQHTPPDRDHLPAPGRAIRGVLLDKDGTLIDFPETWGQAMPSIIGRTAAAAADRIPALAEALGFDLASGVFRPGSPFIAGSSADFVPAVALAAGVDCTDDYIAAFDLICEEEGLKTLTAIGDPAGMIRRLVDAGIAVGIATNDGERSARRQAEALGLGAMLTYIAGYDSGFGVKPAPGMISAFAAQLDCPAGALVMVGDSTHDLVAGRAAGAMTVAVLTGYATRASLAPNADHILDDHSNLPDLIGRLQRGA